MSDPTELYEAMAGAVESFTPQPPPLAALHAAYRRRHRRRLVAGALSVVVVMAGIGWSVAELSASSHNRVYVGPTASSSSPGVSETTVQSSMPKVLSPPGGTVVIPDLVGLTVSEAQRKATTVGLQQILVGAESVSRSTVPGTVVAQTPPAGTTAVRVVSLTIAVPETAPCTSNQLAVTYLGGAVGGGNDFGTLVVRDVSLVWCTLSGLIQVVGVDRTGRAVTQAVTVTVPHPLALSAGAPAPELGASTPLGQIEARILISADYRDGPQPNGLCDTLQVVPTDWRLNLPGHAVLTVPNDDPNAQHFTTCRGQMNNSTTVQLPAP